MSSAITVLLADDHAAIRLGMRMVIETSPGLEVVGEASNGELAVSMAKALRPDVVLMDLRMPVLDGVAATAQITQEGTSRVLVLTTFDHDSLLFGALQAGASGFLLKSAEPLAITDALRSIHRGDQVISPEVTARIISAAVSTFKAPASVDSEKLGLLNELTSREREVLEAVGGGLSNHAIGRQLGISEATVKTHVSRVLAKLGLTSRVQAALFLSEN